VGVMHFCPFLSLAVPPNANSFGSLDKSAIKTTRCKIALLARSLLRLIWSQMVSVRNNERQYPLGFVRTGASLRFPSKESFSSVRPAGEQSENQFNKEISLVTQQ
jgi:hypothetical protein